MAVNYTSILLLFIYLYSVRCDESVPVLLWESKSVSDVDDLKVSALGLMSNYAFEDLLLKKQNDKDIIVLFVEETLGVEDLSWRSEMGESSFPNLEALSSTEELVYLPRTRDPMSVLYDLPRQGPQWQHMTLTPDGLDIDLSALDPEEHYLLINFEDAAEMESRMDMLKRHDAFIDSTYKKLKENRKVLALYTAHQSSWHSGEESHPRRVRETDTESSDRPEITTETASTTSSTPSPHTIVYNCTSEYCVYGYGSSVMIYSSPTPYIIQNETTRVDLNGSFTYEINDATETEDENSPILRKEILSVTYKDTPVTLRFNFNLYKTNTWQLDNVTAIISGDAVNLTYAGPAVIQAPLRMSYHCSSYNNNNFTNSPQQSRTNLTFTNLQIQSFMVMDTDKKIQFGDAYDCVTFMTPPILSGLFITAFLGLILIWGMSMILSIKTMDRFDDSKGKTITINALE